MAGKVMRLDLLNSESYVVVFLFAIIFTDGGVYFGSKNKRIFSQYIRTTLDPLTMLFLNYKKHRAVQNSFSLNDQH